MVRDVPRDARVDHCWGGVEHVPVCGVASWRRVRVLGVGFLFSALGFIFQASGPRFRVSGSGFRVPGFGYGVLGPGFQVSCFGPPLSLSSELECAVLRVKKRASSVAPYLRILKYNR